jgi:3-isopropylmalate/(R)-2-methylmalate dehydratase small subunit
MVEPVVHGVIVELAEADPNFQITIDLPSQTLTLPNGGSHTFPIDQFSKTCLLEGVDQMGYLLKRETEIANFERINGL